MRYQPVAKNYDVYDDAEIHLRQLELVKINDKKQSQLRRIENIKYELNDAERRLENLNLQRREINAECHVKWNVYDYCDRELNRYYTRALETLRDRHYNEYCDLRYRLKNLDEAQIPLVKDEIQVISAKLKNFNLELKDIDANYQKYANDIEKAVKHLNQLENQPELLLLQLKIKIEKGIANFNENNPANQSEIVRKSLIYLQQEMREIMKEEGPNDGPNFRTKYYKLSGLLYFILSEVEFFKNFQNHAFANFINDMIRETHVSKSNTLPLIPNSKGALDFYLNNDRSILTNEMFIAIEKNHHQVALRNFLEKLNRIEPKTEEYVNLLDKGNRVYLTLSHPGENQLDIKFATLILDKSSMLLDNPRDAKLQKQYQRFADQHIYKSSSIKQYVGVLFAFLGAVAAVGCLLAGSYILAPVILLVGAGAGMGLFKSGMCKGAAKAMKQLLETSNETQLDCVRQFNV